MASDMASEIVPSEPALDPVHGAGDPPVPRTFTRSLTFRDGDEDRSAEPFESERLPVTLFPEIQRFLRIANSIQSHEPRVAYVCRRHVFVVVHIMDRHSSGQGVRQFKTSLLKRLEQDDEITLVKRREKTDRLELRRVYQTYKDYIIQNGGGVDLENRERLINARRIASVLFEVLNILTNAAGLEDSSAGS